MARLEELVLNYAKLIINLLQLCSFLKYSKNLCQDKISESDRGYTNKLFASSFSMLSLGYDEMINKCLAYYLKYV